MSRTLYDCPRISRRVTGTLFAAQSLSQAAFIAIGTVSALVAVHLGGQEAWAGVIMILPPPPRQAPEGAGYGERMLQKAIGYQVRLNV